MSKPITEEDFFKAIMKAATLAESSPMALVKRSGVRYHHKEMKEVFELAKRMATSFAEFISNHPLSFQGARDGEFIGLDMKYYTPEQLFELYQQQKQ